MNDDELPTKRVEYNDKVDPVNRKRQKGKLYVDEYDYDGIVHDFNADSVLIDSAIIKQDGDSVWYRYPGKPPVMLHMDSFFAHSNFSIDDSEEQAYYLLSQLESAGYVTGWRKK